MLHSTPTSPVVKQLTRMFGATYLGLGALASASILTELPDVVSTTLAVLIAVVGAIQVSLNSYAQSQVVPSDMVLEFRVGEDVYAGEANDKVGGPEPIRPWEPAPRVNQFRDLG